jgi:hypothetical protein
MRAGFSDEKIATLALLIVLALVVIAFFAVPTRRVHVQRSSVSHLGNAQPARAAGERVSRMFPWVP